MLNLNKSFPCFLAAFRSLFLKYTNGIKWLPKLDCVCFLLSTNSGREAWELLSYSPSREAFLIKQTSIIPKKVTVQRNIVSPLK